MKEIVGGERSTGRGAVQYTAVLLAGEWVSLSAHPAARFHGHQQGEDVYGVELPDDAVTAEFYRSNSGNEQVTTSQGQHFGSFAEAWRWAAEEGK